MPIAQRLLLECLQVATAPFVRFCIRHSVRAQDLIEIVKVNYIRCASSEIEGLGESVTVSRLSAMSGLNRREVMRLQEAPEIPDETKSILHRVLGQWAGDKRFLDKKRKPKALEYQEVNSDFRKLVRLISQDLNPMTVLFELERIGAVEKDDTYVRLAQRAYIPKGDAKGIFKMLARDVADLMESAGSNAIDNVEPPHLHAKTHYDKIVADAVPEIRQWFLKEGAELHQRARAYLGQYDTDLNPTLPRDSKTVRVAIGTFSLVQEKPALPLPFDQKAKK